MLSAVCQMPGTTCRMLGTKGRQGTLQCANACAVGTGHRARPRITVTGGEGGGAGLLRLTHPPSHMRKFFLRKKMKLVKTRNWRSILGTKNFLGL